MPQMIYTVLFVLSIGELIELVARYKRRISVYYVLLFSAVMIAIYGHMQLSTADSIKLALYANQTSYLGASFAPFFLMMCMADLCKVTIKGIYQIFLVFYAFAILLFVSSIGVLPGYYNSFYLVTENGISHLVKEYGPLHNLYPVYLFMICSTCFVMIFRAYKKKRDVSYVTSTVLLIDLLVVVLIYLCEKIFDVSVELLPFAYVICEFVILILLKRISLFDVAAIASDTMVENLTYGFVLCDGKGKYLGADEAAKSWFPELKEFALDVAFPNQESDLVKHIEKLLGNEAKEEITYLNNGDLILEVKHFLLNEQKNKNIHCFFLRDDTKQQQYNKLVKDYNEQLEKDVNAKTKKLRKIQSDIIISMASIVENRDNNTGGHIARTSQVVNIFVDYLEKNRNMPQLTPEVRHCVIKAAPLHDFGKIAIPDSILNKPGRFTDEEYAFMKQHAQKGSVIVEQILRNSDDKVFQKIAVNVAHFHHEKWDGSGYPTGLKGEDIPFEARIMALADVFDALVSKRVYKESMSYDQAFQIIEESCGTHFEPELCQAFLECRPQLEALYDSFTDE